MTSAKDLVEKRRGDLEAAGFRVRTTQTKKEGKMEGKTEPQSRGTAGATLRKRVHEIGEALKEKGLDRAATQQRIEILKEVAPEYAQLQPTAVAVLKELNQALGGDPGRERWRKNPILLADGEAAEEVLRACRENPFVGKILAEQRREATEELRKKATTNLHKTLEGEVGQVAVRVEYRDKFTGQPRIRWVRMEVNAKGHAGQGHVVESTVPFLTGTNREGKEIWFELGNPPEFAEVRSPELRQALVSLYAFEEKVAAWNAKTQEILGRRTISVSDAMAGKVGYFAAHHRDWRTPKGSGSLTYGGEADGKALVLREFFAPNDQIDLTSLLGKEQPLGELAPLLGKIIRYRLGYEAQQRERDAASQDEPAEEDTQN